MDFVFLLQRTGETRTPFCKDENIAMLSRLCYYSMYNTVGEGNMSHSKLRKKGQSLYIDNWNSSAKKYINTCCLCGRKGYSPAVLETDFINSLEREVIYKELTKMFTSALELDSFGRCDECAKIQV